MRTRLTYSVDVLPEEDGRGYYVVVPALPGCFSQGKTIENALENVQEAIALHIHSLRKQGVRISSEELSIHTTVEVAV